MALRAYIEVSTTNNTWSYKPKHHSQPMSLYYILQVEKEWKRGNHSGAFKASRVAKNWGIAGGVVGIISIIGSTIVSVIVPFILAVALRARALNEEH